MWKRVGFRLLLVYFVLYAFPFPLEYMPWIAEPFGEALDIAYKEAACWVAANLLGIEDDLYLGPTGSGDGMVRYVVTLMVAVLSLVIVLLWSLIDRKPREYSRAARWLELGCCLYLGATMIDYGAIKLIPVQMGPPGPSELVTPLGENGRMRLLWTLMGVSPGYQSVTGAAELLGGVLLFWRRTRLLGATLVTIVMTNVVLLNFFYGVPVKLFSSHLLVMAIALLLLDAPRLLAVFVWNRPAAAAELGPMFASRRANVTAQVLKLALLALVLVTDLSRAVQRYRIAEATEEHELWGVHEVESFVQDGELLTDEQRWKRLLMDQPTELRFQGFSRSGWMFVEAMDGEQEFQDVEVDEDARTMTVGPRLQPIGVLNYERAGDQLLLRGEWKGAQVEIRLHSRNVDAMPLRRERFQWIRE
jgi:hypothetical protein